MWDHKPDVEQLALLKRDIKAWNAWRHDNPDVRPNLRGADLSGAVLNKANLMRADLTHANLQKVTALDVSLDSASLGEADLRGARIYGTLSHCGLGGADLREADLSGCFMQSASLGHAKLQNAKLSDAILHLAKMYRVNATDADLTGARLSFGDFRSARFPGARMRKVLAERSDFREAVFTGADLSQSDLRGSDLSMTQLDRADLREAKLDGVKLIAANLQGANLSAASIFGVAAWDLNVTDTVQRDLVIRGPDQSITLDDIEVAQFVYLLLNNQRVRHVIDTVTSKVVLILGRFTAERIAVLQALREELRRRDYLPILFDFEVPDNRDITETISTLAHMARFVIADLTDPRSIPQELTRIVPILPSVPVQPILLESQQEWAMFRDLARYPWVLPVVTYATQEALIAQISTTVIEPAERKAQELTKKMPPRAVR